MPCLLVGAYINYYVEFAVRSPEAEQLGRVWITLDTRRWLELSHRRAKRRNSATPGRGLKPTRDFPANPKRFPALAAVIWFGNPRFIDSKISDLTLSHCALETGQAAGSCSNPLCVFATLRLCVEIDAGKTQRRKDAKSQGMKRTRARRRTPELSHAGPRTQANPRLPGKPEAFPGVGCSDLVRRSKVHHSKISGHSLWAETQRRPAMSLSRECNREPRETHERKSTPNRVLRNQNGEPLIYAHHR